MLDVARIRADFPLLRHQENSHRLVYLDNAATTQKPQAVLDAIAEYYRTTNANVHRGAYDLAIRATEAYEAARRRVARFVNAWAPEGVVFTRGTTEAINLVAGSYGRANVRAGDTVVVTALDHHSNLVPWQILCQEKGATLRMVEITEDGRLDLSDFGRALERRPKLVAFPYVSNALGTINPAAQLARLAHSAGAVVLVDGAQSTPHLRVDVQALDCDFYALSGHKMLGPMGSGALVAKPALLDAMPPYHGGGEMISRVWDDHSTYNQLPHKFEAGTPNVEGAVGLAAAIDYLEGIGLDRIAEHEVALAEAPSASVCVVEGRYQHVNFIVRANPLVIRLVDVVPPEPSRLLDLARQAIAVDEDLPPVRLRAELLDVPSLAAAAPDDRYVLPCQGAGLDLPGAVDYLDQRPARADWTLVGCERSRQFHRWFYGADADRQVELCPDRLTPAGPGAGPATLLRCCLLERGLRVEGNRAVVPWGTNLAEVQAALRALSAS